MGFSDRDDVEEQLHCDVCEMNTAQLMNYMHAYMLQKFNVDLPGRFGNAERKCISKFQDRYGDADAGRIVKWIMHEHKGEFRGQRVGYFDFNVGRPWFTNQMLSEVREHITNGDPAERFGRL